MKSRLVLFCTLMSVCLMAAQTHFKSRIIVETSDELIEALNDHHIEAHDAERVIQSPEFLLREEEPELFVEAGRHLGLTQAITMKQLVETAKNFGHKPCPIGMALFFALRNKEILTVSERAVEQATRGQQKSMHYNFAFEEEVENGLLPKITGLQLTVTWDTISISTLTDTSPVFPDTVVVFVD